MYQRGRNLYLGLNLRCKLKQLITLYQIITKLETVFQVPMPAAVQTLLNTLSFTSLDLGSVGLKMGCLNLGSFQEELLLYVFAPIVLIGAIAAGCVLAANRSANRACCAIWALASSSSCEAVSC